MKSQEKTRNKFTDALTMLLVSMPLSKITVTDIARKCNVTRQIFYRYFEDKLDLVTYICDKQYEASLKKNEIFEWETSILCLLKGIKERKEFYQYAVVADTDNTLYNIMYNHTFGMYHNIIEYRTSEPIPFEIEFSLKLYCRGGIDLLVEWIASGMQMSCELLKDLFLEAMPTCIRNLITNYEVPLTSILSI